MKEVVTEYPWMKIEFKQTDGSLVCNIVSEGAKGEEEGDLNMTYTFEWMLGHESEESVKEKRVKQRGMAKMAVESTIEVMRKLAAEGKLD